MASVISYDDRGDMVVSSASQVASECLAARGQVTLCLNGYRDGLISPVSDCVALHDASAALVRTLRPGTHRMTPSPQIPVPLTLKSVVSSSFMALQLSGAHTKRFHTCC